MTFDARPLAIDAVLAGVADRHRERAGAAGTRIAVTCAADIGPLRGDEQRVIQILDAVVENAVTHTPGGLVSVSAEPCADTALFRICVTDTGAGIPPEVLATLFETFSVDRDAADGRYGGTGLNLTLVHRLAKALGGTLEAESVAGSGSTFTITLPRGAVVEARVASRTVRDLAHAA
jgi:signal transduction histidine kinase